MKSKVLCWVPSVMALFAFSKELLVYGQHYYTYKTEDILLVAMLNAGISAIFAFATTYVIVRIIYWLIEKIVNILSKVSSRS